jgi:hypothetical protein
MRKIALILAVWCLPLLALAQLETTLPSLTRLHQASYCNPAIIPSYKTSIGIPALSGIAINLNLTALNANTIIKSLDSGNINLNKVYDKMNDANLGIGLNTNIELLHVRFKSKKYYYGIHLTTRVSTQIGISKELVGFAAYGNDYFAGRAMDASSTTINALAFNELGFSVARNYKKFNFGFRGKMYQGIATAQLQKMQFKWQQPNNSTDEIIISTEAKLNTANVPYLFDSLNGQPYKSATPTAGSFLGFKNKGFGFDLGATYDVNNKLTLGASLIDFGYIKWTNETYNYASNPTTVTFSGMSYQQIDTKGALNNYGDSLLNLIKPTGDNKTFTTYLPWRYFITANYKLNTKNTVGAIIQGRYSLGTMQQAYTVNFTHKFGKKVDVTTNYSIIGKTYANWGLGLAAKTGAFQWYIIQDNLLAFFAPANAQVITFRFGFNLVWGELKKQNN